MENVSWRERAAGLIGFRRGRLGFGDRPAILVVDMQAEYVNPDSPWYIEDLWTVAHRIQELLEVARAKAVPIIYTYNGFRDDLADAGLVPLKLPDLEEGVCREGTKGARILEAVAPAPGDFLVNKKRYSAFFGTEVGPLLRGWGTDTAIVTGCVTSGCIRETAYDAFQRGFRTVVPEECVGDRHPELHEQELLILDTWIADVVPLDDAIAYLDSLQEEDV